MFSIPREVMRRSLSLVQTTSGRKRRKQEEAPAVAGHLSFSPTLWNSVLTVFAQSWFSIIFVNKPINYLSGSV